MDFIFNVEVESMNLSFHSQLMVFIGNGVMNSVKDLIIAMLMFFTIDFNSNLEIYIKKNWI